MRRWRRDANVREAPRHTVTLANERLRSCSPWFLPDVRARTARVHGSSPLAPIAAAAGRTAVGSVARADGVQCCTSQESRLGSAYPAGGRVVPLGFNESRPLSSKGTDLGCQLPGGRRRAIWGIGEGSKSKNTLQIAGGPRRVRTGDLRRAARHARTAPFIRSCAISGASADRARYATVTESWPLSSHARPRHSSHVLQRPPSR